MAKKTKNLIDNNFDLDDELNFDDLDFDVDPFKDDRKPSMKIRDGLIEGAKSTASDPAFITRVIRDILPKGFGDTIDLSDKIGSNIRKLYQEGADQVRPAIKDFKRVSSKLIPKDNKYVPDNIKAILKKWEEESKSDSKSGLSAGNQRDMMITQQLGEIFKEQIAQDEKNKTEADVKDRIQEALELNRHKDIFGLLNHSNIALSRISQYQTTINLQYQKKSLELQHRQLFALYDIVADNKATHALHADSYTKLIKNTGLPDWQKINLNELTNQKLFGKFSEMVGTATKSMLPNADEYIQMTSRKIKDKVLGSIKQNSMDFRSALTEAESGAETLKSAEGIDMYSMAGELAGSEITNLAAKPFKRSEVRKTVKDVYVKGDDEPRLKAEDIKTGRYSSEKTGKIIKSVNDIDGKVWDNKRNTIVISDKDLQAGLVDEYGLPFKIDKPKQSLGGKIGQKLKAPLQSRIPEIEKAGDYLENFNENFVTDAEKFRKNNKWRNEEGVIPLLMRGIQDLLPSLNVDTSFNKLGVKNLNAVHPFTLKTDRSINEIIPGYLSRILQEMQIMRTGDTKIELTTFDQNNGRFTSKSKIMKSITDSLFTQAETKRTAEILDPIVADIESNSNPNKEKDKTLTPEEKQQIQKAILSNRSQNKPLTNGLKGRALEYAKAYLNKPDRTSRDELILNRKLNSLVRGATDPRKQIEEYIAQGRQNELVELGIVTRTDDGYQLNMDLVNDAKLGKDVFGDAMTKRNKGKRVNVRRKKVEAVVEKDDTDITQKPNIFKQETRDKFGNIKNTLNEKVDNFRQSTADLKESILKAVKEGNQAPGKKSMLDKLRDSVIGAIDSISNNPNMQDLNKRSKDANKYLKDKFREVKAKTKAKWSEVYVNNESEPRMTETKMSNGQYMDTATGETIEDLEDIKGGVKDVVTDKVVHNADEVQQTVVKDKEGKFHTFKEFVKRSFTNIFNKENKEKASEMFNRMSQDGKRTFRELGSIIFGEAKDIWVQGEKVPRIIASKMQQGHYFSVLTGKPVFRPDDIDGAVMDDKGQVVIAADELPKVVVWDIEEKSFGPIRKLVRGMKSIYGALDWYYRKIGIPLTKFNFKMIGKAARVGTNLTMALFEGGPYSVKDVYVGDEKEPRLYATKIRNGEYFNKITGKPIFHQTEIKSELVDSSGNTVLSAEDLPNMQVYNSLLGIYNPLKVFGLIAKGAGKLATWGMNAGMKASKAMFKFIGKAAGATLGKVWRYISKPESVYVKGESEPRLEAILMKAGRYISEKTGKIIQLVTDIDGPVWDEQTQTRVLSNEDIKTGLVYRNGKPIKTTLLDKLANTFSAVNKFFSKRQALAGSAGFKPIKAAISKEETNSDKTVNILQDIKNIFTKKFDKKPTLGDTDGDGVREGSWQDILAKRNAQKANQKPAKSTDKQPKEKKDGIFGMLAGALQSITGFISGFSGLLKGGAVLKGLGSLLGMGGAGSAIAGAVSAGAAALGTVGAGLAAVVGSPVTLGVLGAAVVGYGAYRGYKAIKGWMNKPSTMDAIRYVQYGFKKDDANHFSKITELEEYLKEFTTVGTDKIELNEKKIDVKKTMSIFGMDPDTKGHKAKFGKWFMKRFKPVYLTHVTAINLVTGKTELSKISTLKKEDKKAYIEASKFPGGPYDVNILPSTDKDLVATTASDVEEIIQLALKETEADKGKDTKSSIGGKDKTAAAIVDTLAKKDYTSVDSKDKIPGGRSTTSATANTSMLQNTVSAFDSIRFKTYGLTELDTSKVTSLLLLEAAVAKKILFQDDKATLDANPNEMLSELSTQFGVPSLVSKQAAVWVKWFNNRFLPVYLNYSTLYMLETGKQPKPNSPNVLKPNKQYEVAKAISATSGVWEVTDSPWSDYVLNNDPESIKGNLDLLQQSIKPETYEDKAAKPKSENTTPTKPAGRAYSGAAGYGDEPIKNTVPNQGNTNLSSGVDTSVADDKKKETTNLDRSSADARPGMMKTNYKGPPASISDPATNALLDFIGQKESNGNYNILVGGKTEPNLTNMTISEVLDYQKTMLRRGHESTAVGKYQIIKKTLMGLVKAGYAKLTDVFNPQTQDKLALGLLKDAGLNRYLSKKISTEKFADNISGIWASLPFKTGKSFHHGVGSNKSSGSRESFVSVVAKLAPGSGDVVNDGYVMPGAVASSRQVDPNGDTNKTTPATGATATMAAAQAPVTKSIYNPVARPEMMKVKAEQASREASTSLNDAGGFNPASLNTNSTVARNNANKNALPSDLMANTENILSKSLEVQSQTLEVMKKIFEKINKEDATNNSGKVTTADNKREATSGGYAYQPPSVPVQYRKSV